MVMQVAQKLPLVPAQLAALLQPEMILLDLQAREKLPALRELVTALQHHPALPRPEAFFRELLARERNTNTAPAALAESLAEWAEEKMQAPGGNKKVRLGPKRTRAHAHAHTYKHTHRL